jgi:hypothetical protein
MSVRLKQGLVGVPQTIINLSWFSGAGQNTTGITAATPGVMAGLAGTITPVYSGRTFVSAAGFCHNDTPSAGATIFIRSGTGTKPAFNAAATGTGTGNQAFNTNGANPVYLSWACSGMYFFTPGVTYWLDVSVFNTGGGITQLYNSCIQAFEF